MIVNFECEYYDRAKLYYSTCSMAKLSRDFIHIPELVGQSIALVDMNLVKTNVNAFVSIHVGTDGVVDVKAPFVVVDQQEPQVLVCRDQAARSYCTCCVCVSESLRKERRDCQNTKYTLLEIYPSEHYRVF